MAFTGLDGGIMVALAAGLWLVYLMPTWFKRREYAAVEKTNVRRQQAMRILQETAPVQVRVEEIVSPTGQVKDPARLADAIKRSKDAQAARERNRRFAESTSASAQAASSKARVARRLRRTRSFATLLLLASVATLAVQVTMMVTGGVAAGAWTVLLLAGAVAVFSFAALGRLASIARRRASIVAPAVARPMRTRVIEDREAARPPVATWTPVPLPKPLYLSRSEATPAESVTDPLESLRAAALESDRRLREAQESPEVSPIARPSEPAVAPSRFAAMGVIDRSQANAPDLDAALRRRRAG
jgi:ABC-type multidrug transport system fused ATPase/permease subunit